MNDQQTGTNPKVLVNRKSVQVDSGEGNLAGFATNQELTQQEKRTIQYTTAGFDSDSLGAKVKRIQDLAFLTLFLLIFPVATSSARARSNRSSPLTEEQIDIYVLFLNQFLGQNKMLAFLADRTVPLALSSDDWTDACMSGIELESTTEAKTSTHSLGTKFISRIKPRLVEPNRLQVYVPPPNQEKPIKRASKEELTDGFLQISEVVFDKTHRFAVMRYSFGCGGLCSGSRVFVFVFDGEHWKEKTDVLCRQWMS